MNLSLRVFIITVHIKINICIMYSKRSHSDKKGPQNAMHGQAVNRPKHNMHKNIRSRNFTFFNNSIQYKIFSFLAITTYKYVDYEGHLNKRC